MIYLKPNLNTLNSFVNLKASYLIKPLFTARHHNDGTSILRDRKEKIDSKIDSLQRAN